MCLHAMWIQQRESETTRTTTTEKENSLPGSSNYNNNNNTDRTANTFVNARTHPNHSVYVLREECVYVEMVDTHDEKNE